MKVASPIALVCGEASGDRLGAGLARCVRKARPDIELVGVAGPRMIEAGVSSWLDCSVFSVMGYWDAFKRLPQLLRARNRVAKQLAASGAKIFVGIDAPDLNMGLGQSFHRAGGKYIQYICPSFWAWRPERAQLLADSCDLVLAAFPFEQQACAAHKIPVAFVGHPAADELGPPADRTSVKQQLGLDPNKLLLAMLPGSRQQEIKQHLQIYAAAAKLLAGKFEGLQLAIPVPSRLQDFAQAQWIKLGGKMQEIDFAGRAHELLAAADAAIVKSGTATVEAALLDCPQVVVYRLSSLAIKMALPRLGGSLPKQVALPNLILGRKAVTELIQHEAQPEKLAHHAGELLRGHGCEQMRADYAQLRTCLRMQADRRAADSILQLVA